MVMTHAVLAIGLGHRPSNRAVDMIDDPGHFAKMREDWTTLLAASPANNLFLTWEWLWTWWQHLQSGRQLRLVTVRRHDVLQAIAPLVVRPADLRCIPPLPAVELLGSGVIGSDHLDIVLRTGADPDVVPRLADILDEAGQVLALRRMRDEGRWHELAEALVLRGWACELRSDDSCPFIALPTSFGAFLQTCGRAHRANFLRRLRRLRALHAVRFEPAADEDARQRTFATLCELHDQRWRIRGTSDFLAPAARDFHDAFTQIALQRGWLRLYVLTLDGRPAAAWYGFRYGDVFSFYQSGFAPDLAPLGVGLVAMGLAIEAAIAEGATFFDFLHGDEPYKSLWTQTRRALWRLDATPPGFKRMLYVGATTLRRGAADVLRALKSDAAKTH